MSRAGEVASAGVFHWCARVLRVRRTMVEELVERRRGGDSVRSSEHPHSRFTLEGNDSAGECNYQLDGDGSWMWAPG